MDDVTLLPCPNPWCDCPNDLSVDPIIGTRLYSVGCGCGFGGPTLDSKERAIAAWNTRTPSPDSGERMREARFWLIVHEPGKVPDRKGPWLHTGFREVMRDFIGAYPTAYLTVLTVDADGTPWVQHGPEALQMADGRSMSVGRKHNARTLAAHSSALQESAR
jgi:hypothetical protein